MKYKRRRLKNSKKSGSMHTLAKRNSRLPLICNMQFAQISGTIKTYTCPAWTKQPLKEIVDNNSVIVKIVTSGRTGKARWISDANK